MNTKMIAIAVVAVIVVAGAGVGIALSNNKSNVNYEAGASQLQIRGNVNDDMTIDSKDMEIFDKIVSEEYKAEDYPLADVNADGKVDDADKTLLQDLIDRKAGTKVYVICLDRAGNTTYQTITYPLRDVVTYGTNVQLPTLYANGGQYVAGYFSHSYATAESSISSTARDLEGATRSIPETSWANFTKLDSDLDNGVGAFIVDYSGISAITDSYAADITAGNIPLLIFSSADASAEITTVLTLGFLFGGDCETMGNSYATKSWEIINKIGRDVAGISDKDKTTYIGCTMYIYICQNRSTFASSGVIAGGMPYYKTNSAFAEAYDGTGSVKMSSVEALSNYKDIGAILNNRSMDWGLDPSEVKKTIIDSWDHDNAGTSSTQYFKGFESKLAYIDNLLPGAVKVAYMAHALYGDKFSLDYSNGVLLQFIELGTNPLKGQSLDTIVAYIDKGIYDDAVSRQDVVVGDNAVNMAYSLYQNYTGKYKTGAASATYGFANGSNSTSATLAVANTNADPEANKNTITITVAADAKTAYTKNYGTYSALVSAETNPYTAATLTSSFYGLYGCYKNGDGVGTAYVTGYVNGVLFDCYLYEDEAITNDDLQILVTALFNAITNPVTYDGAPIPDASSTGAKLMAETLAFNDTKWSVSSTTEPTKESAVAILAGKNAMGNDATFNVPIKAGYNLNTDFATASAAVTAHIGEEVSTKNHQGAFAAYEGSVAGVQMNATYGHIAGKTYTYLYFVMKYNDILVDCSATSAKICITNANDDSVNGDVLALLTEVATALRTSAESEVEMTAHSLVANGTKWSIPTGEDPTAASATVTYATKSAMGKDTTYNFSIVSSNDADSLYTTKSATVDGHLSDYVSSKNNEGSYAAYNETFDGVQLHAIYGHIEGKSYSYVYFVMKCGDVIIDGSTKTTSLYNTTESQLATDTAAFFTELANALQA